MMEQKGLTVERVLEETLEDVRSYYHGRALQSMLTYATGDADKLNAAAGYIRKLLDLEQLQAGRANVPGSVTAIK